MCNFPLCAQVGPGGSLLRCLLAHLQGTFQPDSFLFPRGSYSSGVACEAGVAWFVELSCRDSLPWSKPSFWDILLSIICPCCSSVVYQGYHVTPVRHQSWGACFFPWKPLRPPWMTFQTCRTYSTHTVYLILLSNVPRSLLLLVTYLARVTAWAWTPFEADVCECNGEEVREPCVPGEGPG